MAIIQQVTCDVCGKAKGDINHWWISDSTVKAGSAWGLMPWIEAEAIKKGIAHLCGQECVIKAVSEWMAKASGGK